MKRSRKKDTWSKRRYAQTARLLKSFGYKVKYDARKKSQPVAVKSALKRLYNKKAAFFTYASGEKNRQVYEGSEYKGKKLVFIPQPDGSKRLAVVTRSGARKVKPREYNFLFKKLDKKDRGKLRGLVSKSQFTPTGVFIEKPASISIKSFKIEIEEDGIIYKMGRRKDKVIRLDEKLLARDPEKAIKQALGKNKPKSYSLMVNGFRGRQGYTMKEFFHYITDRLLPDWMEKNDGDEEEFSDIFHLRLIY